MAVGVGAFLPIGCDLPSSHLTTFGLGYLFGRWEATRVEIVTTERTCYQEGVQIPCP